METLVPEYLSGDIDECGKTIDELMDEYQDYTTREVAKELFPRLERNEELVGFVGGLTIYGIDHYNACKECGCQVVEADEDEWHNYECENPSCGFTYGEKPF